VFITDLPDTTSPTSKHCSAARASREANLQPQRHRPRNLPSGDFAINQAWLTTTLIAHDLLAWTRMICLDG